MREQRAESEFQDQRIRFDISHTKRLSPREVQEARTEALDFLEGIQHYFDQVYLHLDVSRHREQTRGGIPQYQWRALLVTDNGRYYADDVGFGVADSLHNTFEALETEISSRVDRLAEQERGSTIGI